MSRIARPTPILRRVVLLLLVMSGVPLVAQQAAPPAAAPAPAAPQDAPPVRQFPATGITLDEAVKIALQHDPNVKRSAVDVQFAAGVAQQLKGAFDYTLSAHAEYTHRTQELSESAKAEQKKNRDKLDALISDEGQILELGRELGPLLEKIKNAPPGGLPLTDIAKINPTIATTLAILDQLILTTPDPAQRAQLLDIRQKFINDVTQQFNIDFGEFEDTHAKLVERRRNLGDTPVDEVFIDANAVVRLDKLFRSGIFLSPFMDATFNGTNFKGKPSSAEFGGKGALDQLQFRAGVDFTLPLLRGRGILGTAAQERASLAELEASRLALSHESAASALATINAYWNARAAQDVVDISTTSLKFQNEALTATRQLIAAQQIAGIEEARAQASLARAESALRDAERRLLEARVALADAMGVAVTADPATLPSAADRFPEAPGEVAAMMTLLTQAIGQRQDLASAVKTTEAGEVALAGAQRNLAARFDVSGSTFFTAIGQGSGYDVLDRWVGPSGRIALDYEKPFGNNTQRGQYVQAEADLAQRRIAQLELDRQIRLGVVEAAGSVQQAAASLAQAQASVAYYGQTIEAMMRLLASGNARLIDALTTQQQQVDAMLAVVSAQQELATRMARLRFQTGSLLVGGQVIVRDGVEPATVRK